MKEREVAEFSDSYVSMNEKPEETACFLYAIISGLLSKLLSILFAIIGNHFRLVILPFHTVSLCLLKLLIHFLLKMAN